MRNPLKRHRTQYRISVCNLGSIIPPPAPSPWTTDGHAIEEYRARFADLRCFDRCPTHPSDWTMHSRHLLLETRAGGGDA